MSHDSCIGNCKCNIHKWRLHFEKESPSEKKIKKYCGKCDRISRKWLTETWTNLPQSIINEAVDQWEA